MKYLVIGGVAGGATAAARLRRMDENADIILFERGKYVSYAIAGYLIISVASLQSVINCSYKPPKVLPPVSILIYGPSRKLPLSIPKKKT